MIAKTISLIICFWAFATNGQLHVTVSTPKISGQKADVPLALKNGLSEKIESARAVVFLMDQKGNLVATGTRWIIGETSTNGLAAGATNAFHFVVTSDKPFATTNLTAKLTFSRVVLSGGKLADVAKDVKIETTNK